MSLGTLALIGICGLCGPLLSAAGRGAIPVVVGEILAGVVIGQTGFHAINTSDPTLTFLADIGFAMLMFNSGMNIPLHDERVRASLGRGALAAGVVAVLAVGAGLLVSAIGSTDHPAIYAVLIASGSAAVVLPVVQERRLGSGPVLTVIAQVAVADIAATIAIPFVLAPAHASRVAEGTILIAGCVIAIFAFARLLRGRAAIQALRRQGKRRRWALDLRVALIILFGLSWIAERTGASLLIAGFGAGLMVAAIGGPKRLSHEVLGVAGGLFVPLFFVVLGARVDLRGLAQDPAMIGLALALVGLTVAVHVLATRVTRQPPAAALLASAQLGVPAAIVALGLSEHVITSTQGAAIVAASMLSLAVCSVGAAALTPRAPDSSEPPADSQETPAPPLEPAAAGTPT
jgi:Kef-type K+ transport system membrane component KefB